MKVKENKLVDLVSLGFKKVALEKDDPFYNIYNESSDKPIEKYLTLSEIFHKSHYLVSDTSNYVFRHKADYIYHLGHSRRGQNYYIIVDKTRYLTIFASEADGEGSNLLIDMDVFIKLYKGGFVE